MTKSTWLHISLALFLQTPGVWAVESAPKEMCGLTWQKDSRNFDNLGVGVLIKQETEGNKSTAIVKDVNGKTLATVDLQSAKSEIKAKFSGRYTLTEAINKNIWQVHNLSTGAKFRFRANMNFGYADNWAVFHGEKSHLLVNLATGQQHEIGKTSSISIALNLATFYLATNPNELIIKNLLTGLEGKVRLKKDSIKYNTIVITSPTEVQVHLKNNTIEYLMFNKRTNTWVSFNAVKGHIYKLIPSTDLVLRYVFQNEKGELVHPNFSSVYNKNIRTEFFDPTTNVVKFSLPFYISSLTDDTLVILNLKNQGLDVYHESDFARLREGQTVTPIGQLKGDSMFLSVGKWLVGFNSQQRIIELFDTEKKTITKIRGFAFDEVKESANGERLLFVSNDPARLLIYNLKTQQTKWTLGTLWHDVVLDENFTNAVVENNGDWERPVRMCFKNTIAIEANPSLTSPLPPATLCKAPFNKPEWDKLTPATINKQISLNQALAYLMRFQKKGGFDFQTRHEILESILLSEMLTKYPSEIEQALKSVALIQPTYVRSLYTVMQLEFPLRKTTAKGVCRSLNEQVEVDKFVIEMAVALRGDQYDAKTANAYFHLFPFKNDFAKLDAKSRKNMAETIGENLAIAAGRHPSLQGSFHSKLYYFAKKFGMRIAGATPRAASDLSMALQGDVKAPVALASEPFNEEPTLTDTNQFAQFGFYFRPFKPIFIEPDQPKGTKTQHRYSWQYRDDTLTAEVNITSLGNLTSIVPKSTTPPYEQFLSDKKMVGMIISAPHMGSMATYKEYLTKVAKFKFGKPRKENTLPFVQQAIESGLVDYLTKDAHSVADEWNFVSITKSSVVTEGFRQNTDGTIEQIILVDAEGDQDTKIDAYITIQEFGQWVRKRPSTAPLFYINGACSSIRNVVFEYTSAASPLLTVIGTTTTIQGFFNLPDDPTRILLEGLRNRKNYTQIRQDLMTNPEYKSGEKNHYIFPDEEAFDRFVRDNLRQAVELDIKVRDSRGNVIEPADYVDR